MLKKIFISTIILASTIIMGCNNSKKFEFSFENFNGYFSTNKIFIQEDENIHGLTIGLLKNNIISIYKEKEISNKSSENTGYIDSIIIIKKHSLDELDNFITKNTKKIKINGYSQEAENKNSFTCKENNNTLKKIELKIINSSLKQNLSTIYFTQGFFKYKDYIYIISYSTDDQNERDKFAKDITNLKCSN